MTTMTKRMKTMKTHRVRSLLADSAQPLERRKQLLMHLCLDESEEAVEALHAVLASAAAEASESLYAEKIQELEERRRQMEEGPLRQATFLRLLEAPGSVRRANVLMEDGSTAYVCVPEEELATSLRCGDTVLLEAQGHALLFRDGGAPQAGEEARFERLLPGNRVEVSLRDVERHVYRAAAPLNEMLESREVTPGQHLLVCPRRQMAFAAIPNADELSHFRYLVRAPVPDVVAGRDLGAPPTYIGDFLELVREELTKPEIRRRFRLPRCALKLLTGPTGTGKTFSIQALWRALYELMAEVTGTPLEELPPRVVRLRSSQVLSKWLGESDKNLDRFFDEVERLATDVFTARDGRTYELPVLAVLEEIDGIARTRGEEPVLDRILTTALQRLDPTRPELRGKLILFVATTNVAHQVDAAFLRRVGGTIERFGRLSRGEFVAVLDKHLAGRPIAADAETTEDAARRRMIGETTAWLFAPRETDEPQLEISFAGAGNPAPKHRRDFLTAGLVDRAVRQAAESACRRAVQEAQPHGLTCEELVAAFDQQIRSLIEGIRETNLRDYVDVPDGARVASVRRVRPPAVQPYQLVRAA